MYAAAAASPYAMPQAAANATGLFSLPAGHGTTQSPLAGAAPGAAGSTGNPLLDAYSQYAALLSAGYAAANHSNADAFAAAGLNGLNMSGQQQGERVGHGGVPRAVCAV
jgi:hypothetical protein